MAWSDIDLDEIFERTCHLCGGEVRWSHYGRLNSRHGWEVDHDHPVALGGDDDLDNLRAAHPSCNRAKGAMSSDEFRAMLADVESQAVPILAVSAGAGLIAGAAEPDQAKKLQTGLKWALGTAIGLAVLQELCG